MKQMDHQKIFFELEDNQWHRHTSESLWGLKITEDIYKVDNIPSFVYGVSLGDIIKCQRKAEDHKLWFERILERSGNSTYRILIKDELEKNRFIKYWKSFKDLGCTYESTSVYPETVAINVPATSNIYQIYELLEKGESEGSWTFEEGYPHRGGTAPSATAT